MKTSHKKALILLSVLSLFSILNFFFPFIYSSSKHLILLGVVLIALIFLLGINLRRISNDKTVLRNMLIYILIYYLVIYILGLFTGFVKTVYSYSLTNLIHNIIPSILTILGMEIIRYVIINKTDKDKKINIITCAVFILFEVSISFAAYNFAYKDDIYQFIGLIVIGSITKNILMNIIYTKTDYIPGIIYRLLLETIVFILILIPNLGPYLKSVSLILLPSLISVMIINMNKSIIPKPKTLTKKGKLYIALVIILLILVGLNSGLLRYRILVIGSNSMLPKIAKGDVVFVEQLKGQERRNVEIGEVLTFRYDNKIICHRVASKAERVDNVYYKTKGDNNSQEDSVMIPTEQVIGKVLFRIKYIGLPSVWLSELFSKR